jgi:hypothetical protein
MLEALALRLTPMRTGDHLGAMPPALMDALDVERRR